MGFIRKAGFPDADAEDLAQEVFMRHLTKDILQEAEEGRGRLRSFLLGVTKSIIGDERRKRSALKRGGASSAASIDDPRASEPEAEGPPEEEFDRSWVINLLRSALDALREERSLQHQALVGHVLEGKEYRQIAQELEKSIQDIKNYPHRVRQRLADLLQKEIARYSSCSEEYEEERPTRAGGPTVCVRGYYWQVGRRVSGRSESTWRSCPLDPVRSQDHRPVFER